MHIRDELVWPNFTSVDAPWMSDFLVVPADASVPLAMTGPHPDAVGSYGADAIEWVRVELGIELRWWQRLAFVRQLEHDVQGRLVWRTIVESGPRRVGKSVRLRAGALWRLEQSDLFGETQLALHTGKDVAIVREIHRQAWAWASERDGWAVRKGVGQEEVLKGVHRWLVRSTDSVYGYDVTLGMVDEAWAVAPATFDEGLEPASMERKSPQLLLTSTAHRRATSLMRKKLSAALSQDDGETLLMLWGAHPDADPGDPETWRAASPHWSEDRRRMIEAKYAAALANEVDPELDDPDPMEGFVGQYLNVWRLNEKPQPKGNVLVEGPVWAGLVGPVVGGVPDSVAVETWFDKGISVAFAWREVGNAAHVQVHDCSDLAGAAALIVEAGFRGRVTVGASVVDDPALGKLRTVAGQGRTAVAVAEFGRLVAEDRLTHDGSELLAEQVLGVRTSPGPDGPRLVSSGRGDAIKAVVWAVAALRPGKVGKPRILLPDK